LPDSLTPYHELAAINPTVWIWSIFSPFLLQSHITWALTCKKIRDSFGNFRGYSACSQFLFQVEYVSLTLALILMHCAVSFVRSLYRKQSTYRYLPSLVLGYRSRQSFFQVFEINDSSRDTIFFGAALKNSFQTFLVY